MKRLLFGILLAAALLLAVPAYAAAEGIVLSCAASVPDADGSVDLAVELTGCEGVAMMQFSLLYDAERLSCVGAETGALFRGNFAPTVNTQRPGEVVMSWDSLTPLQSGGTVLLLHMRLLAEEAEVHFGESRDLVFAREDFIPLEVSRSGCTIEKGIAAAPAPSSTPAPSATTATPAPSVTPAPSAASSTPASSAPSSATSPPEAAPASAAASEPAEPEIEAISDASETVIRHGESNGLTMQSDQVALGTGETQTLTIQEDEPSLVWFSSDERVATVDENGTVTAHESGTAMITASSADGTAYASCAVLVEDGADSGADDSDQPVSSAEETEPVASQPPAPAPSKSAEPQSPEEVPAPTVPEEPQQSPGSSLVYVVLIVSAFLLLGIWLFKKFTR